MQKKTLSEMSDLLYVLFTDLRTIRPVAYRDMLNL